MTAKRPPASEPGPGDPLPPGDPGDLDAGADPGLLLDAGDGEAPELPPDLRAAAEEDAADDDEAEPDPSGRPLPVPAGEQGLVRFDPLRRYLAEIRDFRPLSAEEERELALRYQKSGDVEAAYRLTTSHLRLVVRIAFDFKRSWLNLLDLVQEGNVGLLLAIRKFDPYRGIRLSTYAAWWIRAYIIKFLLDNWSLVRVGTTNARRKLLFNLRREKDALAALGIVPSPKLLAERLDVSEQDVIEVDRSLGVPDASLDAPLGADRDRSLADLLPSPARPIDEQVADKERSEILRAKLAVFAATLAERERTVLRERMLADEPATLEELGRRFGITREGLRQVEKRIRRDLKAFLSREIKDFRALDLRPPGPEPASPARRRRARGPESPRQPSRRRT